MGEGLVNLGKSACWLSVEFGSSVSPPVFCPCLTSVTEGGAHMGACDCG